MKYMQINQASCIFLFLCNSTHSHHTSYTYSYRNALTGFSLLVGAWIETAVCSTYKQHVASFVKKWREIFTAWFESTFYFHICRCVIAELFTEGHPAFDLSQLLAYRSGQYDPEGVLEKIEDESIRVGKINALI